MIRPVTIDDAKVLLDIYNYYVEHTAVTFDLEPLSLKTFEEKLKRINADYPFIVYEEEGVILGYAYGSRFRPKPAYNFVVETTVYVKQDAHGRRIGTKLYEALLELIKETNMHTAIGILTIPNAASARLHEKFGFRKIGDLEEVGLKFGKWHNIGIYQLKLS